jgi:adenine deaminase
MVAEEGKSKIESGKSKVINNFSCSKKKVEDFEIKGMSSYAKTISNWLVADGPNNIRIPVIEALDGQLITNKIEAAVIIMKKSLTQM